MDIFLFQNRACEDIGSLHHAPFGDVEVISDLSVLQIRAVPEIPHFYLADIHFSLPELKFSATLHKC